MRKTLAALALVVLVGPFADVAGGAFVDRAHQSDVFKRIFAYDKDLRDSEKIVVLVISTSKSDDDTVEIVEAFRSAGLYPAVVSPSQLGDDLTTTLTRRTAVVYVSPGIDYDAVKAFTTKNGYLSIAATKELAESGHTSVGVGDNEARPEIIVHMGRLAAEGHELSAELLKLARVIRE